MKKTIKKLFNKFGYKVVNINSTERDAYRDQVKLIGGNKNITIFDVGACTGSVTFEYLQLFRKSTIFSFEPFVPSFEILKKAMLPYENVQVFNIAISEKTGTTEFNVNESAATNSMLETHPDSSKNWNQYALNTTKKIQIDTITLDEFIENKNIDKIDILKLDTQGTEYQILTGSKKAIRENKISLIYLEIITRPTYSGQKNLEDILSLLRVQGFILYNFYNFSYNDHGALRQVDAIFTKEM